MVDPRDAAPGRWSGWRWALASVVVLSALLQILPNAGSLNHDGVAYLDMARRIADGHLKDALTGYWSPLFPVLVAPVFALVPTSTLADPYVGYGVLFLSFLLAAAGFRHLLRQLPRPDRTADAPDTAFELAAWAVFVWVTLGLIRLHVLTPDTLAAALLFWATGEALRACRSGRALPAFLSGAAWGLAGMAKAAMIPLALFGIAAVAVGGPLRKGVLRRGGLALAGWLVVAGPFIAGLSLEAGRLTIGSASALNYQWAVSGRGGDGSRSDAIRIRTVPVEPGITHLYQYDPTRSPSVADDPGMPVPRPPRLRRLLNSSEKYWYLLSPFLAVLLALLLMDLPGIRDRARWRRLTPLWLPALAGLAMYALVFILPRYVAPFLGLLALAVLAGLRPGHAYAAARPPVLAGLAAVLLAFGIMASVYSALTYRTPDAAAATSLLDAGPRPGDRVAVIAGDGAGISPVLRAAGLQVSGFVSRSQAARLRADFGARQEVFETLAGTGARWAILLESYGDLEPSWRVVPGAGFWIRPLDGAGSPSPDGSD